MNIYIIYQSVSMLYDTYDSAVVIAKSADEARMIHPSGDTEWEGKDEYYHSWCNTEDVSVELIGVAKEGLVPGVMLASFNAG